MKFKSLTIGICSIGILTLFAAAPAAAKNGKFCLGSRQDKKNVLLRLKSKTKKHKIYHESLAFEKRCGNLQIHLGIKALIDNPGNGESILSKNHNFLLNSSTAYSDLFQFNSKIGYIHGNNEFDLDYGTGYSIMRSVYSDILNQTISVLGLTNSSPYNYISGEYTHKLNPFTKFNLDLNENQVKLGLTTKF